MTGCIGRRSLCLFLPIAFAFSAGTSFAQQSNLERFERQRELIRARETQQGPKEVPVSDRVLFEYGGYFSFDYLSVDDSNGDNHVLRQYDPVVYARLNLDGVHDFFFRGRATYQDFAPGDSFDGEGSGLDGPTIDRLYYRFDLAANQQRYGGKIPSTNVALQGGRDVVYWGNGLTIATVLDGAIVDLANGPFAVQLVAGITPVHDTVDIDSSRPSFDDHTKRGFFGALLSHQVGQHKPYLYGLIQRDYNPDDTLDVPPTTTQFNYNSYYIGAGSVGAITDKLLYGVEVVYEGGTTLSNSFNVDPPFLIPIDQTEDPISAGAADIRLDYLFNDVRRSRASFEATYATGDSDRFSSTSNTFGGNKSGTTDGAFNSFGLLNTGLAFAPSVSNMIILRTGLSTFPLNDYAPLRRLQVGVDVFVYNKARSTAPIDEPTQDGRYLGWEPDLFLNWQVTGDLTFAVRYGVFFPSSDTFTDDDARQFISTSLTYSF